MPEDKGLNRGGTMGQEGELSEGADPTEGRTNIEVPRDEQKQQGGIRREPNLEKKHEIQPKHQVD